MVRDFGDSPWLRFLSGPEPPTKWVRRAMRCGAINHRFPSALPFPCSAHYIETISFPIRVCWRNHSRGRPLRRSCVLRQRDPGAPFAAAVDVAHRRLQFLSVFSTKKWSAARLQGDFPHPGARSPGKSKLRMRRNTIASCHDVVPPSASGGRMPTMRQPSGRKNRLAAPDVASRCAFSNLDPQRVFIRPWLRPERHLRGVRNPRPH